MSVIDNVINLFSTARTAKHSQLYYSDHKKILLENLNKITGSARSYSEQVVLNNELGLTTDQQQAQLGLNSWKITFVNAIHKNLDADLENAIKYEGLDKKLEDIRSKLSNAGTNIEEREALKTERIELLKDKKMQSRPKFVTAQSVNDLIENIFKKQEFAKTGLTFQDALTGLIKQDVAANPEKKKDLMLNGLPTRFASLVCDIEKNSKKDFLKGVVGEIKDAFRVSLIQMDNISSNKAQSNYRG